MGGILIKHKLETKKGTPSIYAIKKMHKYIGIIVYIISKI